MGGGGQLYSVGCLSYFLVDILAFGVAGLTLTSLLLPLGIRALGFGIWVGESYSRGYQGPFYSYSVEIWGTVRVGPGVRMSVLCRIPGFSVLISSVELVRFGGCYLFMVFDHGDDRWLPGGLLGCLGSLCGRVVFGGSVGLALFVSFFSRWWVCRPDGSDVLRVSVWLWAPYSFSIASFRPVPGAAGFGRAVSTAGRSARWVAVVYLGLYLPFLVRALAGCVLAVFGMLLGLWLLAVGFLLSFLPAAFGAPCGVNLRLVVLCASSASFALPAGSVRFPGALLALVGCLGVLVASVYWFLELSATLPFHVLASRGAVTVKLIPVIPDVSVVQGTLSVRFLPCVQCYAHAMRDQFPAYPLASGFSRDLSLCPSFERLFAALAVHVFSRCVCFHPFVHRNPHLTWILFTSGTLHFQWVWSSSLLHHVVLPLISIPPPALRPQPSCFHVTFSFTQFSSDPLCGVPTHASPQSFCHLTIDARSGKCQSASVPWGLLMRSNTCIDRCRTRIAVLPRPAFGTLSGPFRFTAVWSPWLFPSASLLLSMSRV
nr:hypothetical protein Iba_chr01fCG4480 [Ipomoea batatas]